MRNVAELFPVKPRPGQVEAAETLAGLLESGGAVVFTAPPGFGKTLTALVALRVTKLLPAAWRVRALALARHIAEEAALLDLRSEVLPGREKVCPYALELGSDVHEWCRVRRDQCGYFTARSCPYFFYPSADVYVTAYFRRAPPRVIDIWDEAHNLLAPREICVDIEVVVESSVELRSVNSELAKWLRSFLPFLERGEGEVSVDDNQVSSLYVAYLRLLERGGRRTALGRLYRVLSAQSVYAEGGYLCGASVTLPQRRPALFISATLPFPEILGGKVIEIPWAKKYRAVITGLTTRYNDFGEEEVKEYGKLIWDLRKKYERVLVFATERVAKRLSKFADLYEPPEIPEWKGVLLLHTRGRFAEGVDIRADAVVMAGAPFLPPWVTDKLRRTLSKMGFSGDKIAEASMLSTTLQCVGRATRRPEDDPLVVLADERYKRYEEELSKYFEFRNSSVLESP